MLAASTAAAGAAADEPSTPPDVMTGSEYGALQSRAAADAGRREARRRSPTVAWLEMRCRRTVIRTASLRALLRRPAAPRQCRSRR